MSKVVAKAINSTTAEIAEIAIVTIDVGDQLIRGGVDDEIQELAGDIARHGLLQPVGVSATATGRYQLLWGYRRLMACRWLRRVSILARIMPGCGDDVRSVALRENLHRRQLTVAEEVAAVQMLSELEKLTPEAVGAALGRSRSWVLRRLMWTSLPVDVQDAVEAGRVSLSVAEVLTRIDLEPDRAYVIQRGVQERWTVPQWTAAVQAVVDAPPVQDAVDAGVAMARSDFVQQALLMECGACGRARSLSELVVIRVCADGCPGPAAEGSKDDLVAEG